VGVVEAGGGPDLGEEAVVADGGVELWAQDFQRDRPVMFEVGREEYDRGPAASYFAQDGVLVCNRGAKVFRELGRLIAHHVLPVPLWLNGGPIGRPRQCLTRSIRGRRSCQGHRQAIDVSR